MENTKGLSPFWRVMKGRLMFKVTVQELWLFSISLLGCEPIDLRLFRVPWRAVWYSDAARWATLFPGPRWLLCESDLQRHLVRRREYLPGNP